MSPVPCTGPPLGLLLVHAASVTPASWVFFLPWLRPNSVDCVGDSGRPAMGVCLHGMLPGLRLVHTSCLDSSTALFRGSFCAPRLPHCPFLSPFPTQRSPPPDLVAWSPARMCCCLCIPPECQLSSLKHGVAGALSEPVLRYVMGDRWPRLLALWGTIRVGEACPTPVSAQRRRVRCV